MTALLSKRAEYATPDIDIDIKASIEELCWEERASLLPRLGVEEAVGDCEKYRKLAAALKADQSGMDTSILKRIRNGEEVREKQFDDLIAPLRLEPLLPGTEESEKDKLDVILAWNKRIADKRNNDSIERQALIAALEERVKVVDKVLAIVSDDTNSNRDDETGQNGILEPSQRRLLKAIHAYRPETRVFLNRCPFDILVAMLAHIRQEEFETANKDNGIYLALKVLSGQEQLEHRFEREEKRRVYEKKKKDSEENDNRRELRRCETKWRAYNKSLAGRARQSLMDKIQCARTELRKVGIDELLGLSVLRSAQPRVDREAPRDVHTPSPEVILDKCARADDYDALNDELGQHFPDVEAKLEVTANNARNMKKAQNKVLFRMVKLAGADLTGLDETERERIITARLNDPVTARVIEETLEGVLDTRVVVEQVLEHLGMMEHPLAGLLQAATTKRDELAELTRLIDREETPN